MDILVSCENKPQNWWQIEILIQSLKNFGLQDDLVLAAANYPGYSENNLPNCKRRFVHPNVGRTRDYLPLNKPYAITQALRHNLIKQPFCVIDPDMFLVKPLPLFDSPVTANLAPFMDYNILTKDGYSIKTEFPIENWHPIGFVYQFCDVDKQIFQKIYETCQKLMVLYADDRNRLRHIGNKWQKEMVAFIIALTKTKVNIVETLEMPLDEKQHDGDKLRTESCFVHYPSGYLPFFDKRLSDGVQNVPTSLYLPLWQTDEQWQYRFSMWKVFNNGRWKDFLEANAFLPKMPWETILNIPANIKNVDSLKEIVKQIYKA